VDNYHILTQSAVGHLSTKITESWIKYKHTHITGTWTTPEYLVFGQHVNTDYLVPRQQISTKAKGSWTSEYQNNCLGQNLSTSGTWTIAEYRLPGFWTTAKSLQNRAVDKSSVRYSIFAIKYSFRVSLNLRRQDNDRFRRQHQRAG